eukprot:8343125-Pyramimonas_sp.AAC.1
MRSHSLVVLIHTLVLGLLLSLSMRRRLPLTPRVPRRDSSATFSHARRVAGGGLLAGGGTFCLVRGQALPMRRSREEVISVTPRRRASPPSSSYPFHLVLLVRSFQLANPPPFHLSLSPLLVLSLPDLLYIPSCLARAR